MNLNVNMRRGEINPGMLLGPTEGGLVKAST
jgi:hypothetical protein